VQRGGRRPGAATGAAALSPREREIATLVARGSSNKEIAAQLHVSGYTVENRLRKVFSKLAVSKRGAVAAALAAQGGSAL
jgi:DNA-binding NarL/FixJ family response regulator